MKILVTGGRGQLGWELQRSLAPLGEVVARERSEMDLADPDSIVSNMRSLTPGLVVNAAAYTAVDKAESEVAAAFAANARGPGILAEEAKRLGAVVIHYSTDYVFDGTKPGPYTEVDATGPLNAYGRSKLAGEQAIRDAGGAHLILRTSWVFASRGKNFFLTMLRLLRERSEVRVVCDQVGAPTSAEALAQATAALLRRHDAGGLTERSGVYHATASGHTSWYGFAREIARLEQPRPVAEVVPIGSAEFPSPALRPGNSRLSNDKLKRCFGVELPAWTDCVASVYRQAATAAGGSA